MSLLHPATVGGLARLQVGNHNRMLPEGRDDIQLGLVVNIYKGAFTVRCEVLQVSLGLII